MKFNFIFYEASFMSTRAAIFLAVILALAFNLAATAQTAGSQSTPAIQDNSFLVEEAYNQEYGVVQHINSFTKFWESDDWVYTFTQEWPAPGDARHQISYTLAGVHMGDTTSSGSGDVLLNYRYQLIGNGDTRLAFAPRLSVIFPTGNSNFGRGYGGYGFQTNLPASIVVVPKLVTHWNAGATFIPHDKDLAGNNAFSSGFNLGQSFIWLVHPRFNPMLETIYVAQETAVAKDKTEWNRGMYVSPGFRWAYNFKNGLQIVPGVAVPIGVGPSSGEKALLLYLSLEHPFRKIPKQ